jgi:hypothetical protein
MTYLTDKSLYHTCLNIFKKSAYFWYISIQICLWQIFLSVLDFCVNKYILKSITDNTVGLGYMRAQFIWLDKMNTFPKLHPKCHSKSLVLHSRRSTFFSGMYNKSKVQATLENMWSAISNCTLSGRNGQTQVKVPWTHSPAEFVYFSSFSTWRWRSFIIVIIISLFSILIMRDNYLFLLLN